LYAVSIFVWLVGLEMVHESGDVWDVDLPEMKIDKNQIKEQAKKYRMGNVPLGLGRVMNRDEFEDYEMEVLSRRLP